jgi:hypothetical protein
MRGETMKKIIASIIVLAMVFMFAGTALSFSFLPIDDFSDWSEYHELLSNPVIFDSSGPYINIKTDGSIIEAWGKLYKRFSGAIGIMATINVRSVNGNAHVGLQKYLGNWGDNNILAEIWVQRYEDRHTIAYRIRECDVNHETVRVWSLGHFGDSREEWNEGENVIVALARVEEQILFFCAGYGMIKWVPPDPMGPIDSEVEITGWAEEGASNNIDALVVDVKVISPYESL